MPCCKLLETGERKDRQESTTDSIIFIRVQVV